MAPNNNVGSSLESLVAYFKTRDKVRVMDAHTAKVHSVAWNSDGKRLGSGSMDKTIGIHTLDSSRLTKELSLKGHQDAVDQICWHPTNAGLLASASGDRTMKLWDVKAKKVAGSIATKGENIFVTWHPDGNDCRISEIFSNTRICLDLGV